VLFEKPFGFDLISAQEFIDRTGRYFTEDQLYRIDHYMAKEISAELIHLRQNAENHHHHWDNSSVKAITVVATEKIGIEGRVQFYEQTGALRDFVQGHLLQLLSLVLMQQPTSALLAPQRLKALKALQPVDPAKATRAQYEGYQVEVDNPGSTTETFVAFAIESTDPAWRGVPIRLLTGKALHEKRSYVRVEYTDGTEDIFDEAVLTQRDGTHLDAYERVLIEATAGKKDLFTSSPEVLRSWQLLTPLQEAWSMSNEPLPTYPQGTDITAFTLH
jgi:glucose-6-phosphate 1-dehydrogenase